MQEFLAWANTNVLRERSAKVGKARGWIEKTKSYAGMSIALTDAGRRAIASESEYKDVDIEALCWDVPFDEMKLTKEGRERVQKLTQ